MKYTLSGDDRDALHGFVISGTVQPALDFVEALVERELTNGKGTSGVQGSPVKDSGRGLQQASGGSDPGKQDATRK